MLMEVVTSPETFSRMLLKKLVENYWSHLDLSLLEATCVADHSNQKKGYLYIHFGQWLCTQVEKASAAIQLFLTCQEKNNQP